MFAEWLMNRSTSKGGSRPTERTRPCRRGVLGNACLPSRKVTRHASPFPAPGVRSHPLFLALQGEGSWLRGSHTAGSGQRAPGPLPVSSAVTCWAGPGHSTLPSGDGAEAAGRAGAAAASNWRPHLCPFHASRPAVGLTGHVTGGGEHSQSTHCGTGTSSPSRPRHSPGVPASHMPTLTARGTCQG